MCFFLVHCFGFVLRMCLLLVLFVSLRFVSLRFVSLRFVSLRFVSLGFVCVPSRWPWAIIGVVLGLGILFLFIHIRYSVNRFQGAFRVVVVQYLYVIRQVYVQIEHFY